MSKSRTIWVARHAARLDSEDYDWKLRADRPHDTPLSSQGHVQADDLAKRLKDEMVDHIVCSPLLRAVETAVYCARKHLLKVKVETGLSEWFNIPVFNGSQEIIPIVVLATVFTEINHYYCAQGPYPKAEAKEDMVNRIKRTCDELLKHLSGNLLFISHGSPTQEIVKCLTGKNEPMLDIAGCYKLVEKDKKFELAGVV